MSARRIVRVRIQGLVQGVGFRAWMQHQAELHGLDGWARNRRDGAVEAVLAGPPETIDIILRACRQGPRGSRVESVGVQDVDEAALAERPEARGFVVLSTV